MKLGSVRPESPADIDPEINIFYPEVYHTDAPKPPGLHARGFGPRDGSRDFTMDRVFKGEGGRSVEIGFGHLVLNGRVHMNSDARTREDLIITVDMPVIERPQRHRKLFRARQYEVESRFVDPMHPHLDSVNWESVSFNAAPVCIKAISVAAFEYLEGTPNLDQQQRAVEISNAYATRGAEIDAPLRQAVEDMLHPRVSQ